MSEVDWGYELDHPDSRLGAQNRTRRNGTREEPKRSRDRLSRAWKAAADHRAEDRDWSAEDGHQMARATAQAVRDLVADPDLDLTDAERLILDHAAKIADERGSDRLTVPRGAWIAATNLGLTRLRTALASLDRRGLLTCVEGGQPRQAGRPSRANVYRLAPVLTPKAGLAVPLSPIRSVSSAPADSSSGAPRSVSGAPSPEALADYLSTPEGAALARRILAEMET